MKSNNSSDRLSIIIPVLNEEAYIPKLLSYLERNCSDLTLEIIVVDGGSSDRTLSLAGEGGAKVFESERGRASQMNFGASKAKANILYFLHADTIPPISFEKEIIASVRNGYPAGCFRMKFDTESKFLNFFAWFTKVNHRLCRGGDQSLYITKELFNRSGGFNEDYKIYEDTEFVGRIYNQARFKVLPQTVITSARRYKRVGSVKLQYHFGVIHLKRLFGAGPKQLHEYYRRHIAT